MSTVLNTQAMNSNDNNATHAIMSTEVVKSVLKSARLGIWNFTEGGKYGFRATISDECREVFGLGEDVQMDSDEMYKWWRDRVYPDDKKYVEITMKQLLTNKHSEITYRWIHPTLGLRFVKCGGIGRKNDEGRLVLEGYHYDVTDLLENYKQNTLVADTLAKSYALLSYMDLEKDWYTAYWSETASELDVLPRSGTLTGTNEKIAKHLCSEKDADRARRFTDPKTLVSRLKNTPAISMVCQGTFAKWIRISYIVIDRDTNGNALHLIGGIKDVSEQYEHELGIIHKLNDSIEASKSKTMMFQNMIHEIRTPLNAIFGFSQLLCIPRVDIGDDQKKKYLDVITNSYNLLSMLINDVLDIVDAEHGNFRIQKKSFKVNLACRSVIHMVNMRVQAGVKLRFTSEVDDNYMVNSDEQRIEQVLINFLTNACKHTYKGEIHLHVSTTERPGRLTFSVTDTGTGVKPELADDIFVRYRKGNFNVQGSGIGLHICSIIAERLGADILLDKSYTGGARFELVI